VEQQSFAASCK